MSFYHVLRSCWLSSRGAPALESAFTPDVTPPAVASPRRGAACRLRESVEHKRQQHATASCGAVAQWLCSFAQRATESVAPTMQRAPECAMRQVKEAKIPLTSWSVQLQHRWRCMCIMSVHMTKHMHRRIISIIGGWQLCLIHTPARNCFNMLQLLQVIAGFSMNHSRLLFNLWLLVTNKISRQEIYQIHPNTKACFLESSHRTWQGKHAHIQYSHFLASFNLIQTRRAGTEHPSLVRLVRSTPIRLYSPGDWRSRETAVQQNAVILRWKSNWLYLL